MVDQSYREPEGMIKDILVDIRGHYVPADFMVLDMGEEDDVHIVLGRPFLNTTGAIIYMRSGEIHFQFPGVKVRCYFNNYTTYEKPKRNRTRRYSRKTKQAIKEGWADYPGEVTRYEDLFPEDGKSSPEKEAVPPTEVE